VTATTHTSDPRYPVGRFERPEALSASDRSAAIEVLAGAPQVFRAAIKGLNDAQLDTPYRDGGWTVRQVIHHVPDSHMNAYVRCKLALTEDTPTIKPYDEARWAELADGAGPLVEDSLKLLEALHARWVYLLRRMQPSDFRRLLNHPEWKTPMSLDVLLALYAWHCRHHAAHITELRKRKGWL
jgi:hypothetical protein